MLGRTYRAAAIALVAGAGLLLGVMPATALAGAETVIATKADQYKPAASADYVVWNVWDGKHAITYAKAFGGPKVRVLAARLERVPGGHRRNRTDLSAVPRRRQGRIGDPPVPT